MAREKKWPLRIEGLGDGSGDFPGILRGLAPMRSEQAYFLPHCGIFVKLFFKACDDYQPLDEK
jgi:hypothetical protein